MRWTRGE